MKVPAVSRQLAVTITAESPVSRPRAPGRFAIKAVDASGAPVRAQFALGVIDEAVYGVKADATADPLRFFYQRNYSRVGTTFSREYAFVGYSGTQQLMLAMRKRPVLAGRLQGRQARAAAGAQGVSRRDLLGGRRRHRCRGEASVQVTYPDALTTWRLTARGATADTASDRPSRARPSPRI